MFNKIYILLFVLLHGISYPCSNCFPPIANAGDDYTVINGGAGILDGSESYDPDNFDLQLSSLQNVMCYVYTYNIVCGYIK